MIINSKFTFSIILLGLFCFSMADGESLVIENQKIEYEMDGGLVNSIELDFDFIELIINFDSFDDGALQISIPRILLDAKFDELDDIFFVIVNGFETDYVEIVGSDNARTLLIPFFAGDNQIEIIGTDVLLEIDIENPPPINDNSIEIPTWVKNNAGWWAEGKIGDSDFILGIQYLITEGIMLIPETEIVPDQDTSQEIPDWIKGNAGWWSDGVITDSDFVLGIQYLITNGIMVI